LNTTENIQKVCPLVTRARTSGLELLAFEHPQLDKQLVKGTIEPDEPPADAAHRELLEESGLRAVGKPKLIAYANHLPDADAWHFYICHVEGDIPETWSHLTMDDGGHTFNFFWHKLSNSLDDSWHPLFHIVLDYIKPKLESFAMKSDDTL